MDYRFLRAQRIEKLPPYLFAELDRQKHEARKKGMDLIDLGVGDPDLPTPPHIVKALEEAAHDPVNHRYPSYEGLFEFRRAASEWFERRFRVKLDSEREVLSLIGSKEGIGHIPLAFVNPGDGVLVPDPGYPVYQAGTVFAGGEPYSIPLLERNDYLPDLSSIPNDVLRKTRLLFLNYPNNPTAAVAPKEFLALAVDFARKHGLILCHDAAYSEIAFDGYNPSSIMEVEGAREVAVEFHSLSKTFNMTGWRIGFAVGNPEVLAGLGAVKTNLDSGVFQAIQYAGIAALKGPQDCIARMRLIYQKRRDTLVEGLQALGWKVKKPMASFYVWIPVPNGYNSTELVTTLLSKAGIVTTPGIGFGKHGEGYIRVALTVDIERIQEAVERIKGLGIRGG